jgi:ABC-2 type transport system permease protein
MRHIWSIAAKELRGFFHSPVALIFLATFLGVVLFTFFWVDAFFARGLADVRPMFDWLPLLLIFLVAALTMRLWSEEQKLGTIEILMTLPVPLYRLVLGKFVAGLLLVALALGMTLGLPITVSMMGPLDWGPVLGGYVGALLLASAYLSIGLCVSSLTDNQIVALIFTVVACLLFFLPGADAVVGFFGHQTAEILRGLGTGSRFESVARGVIDLRDLAYYGGLVALFLTLNTAILYAKRWSAGARTAPMRRQTKAAVALVLGNVLALNLWLSPLGSARLDLTEDKLFSLSPVTAELIRRTSEPLLIRGYFTSDTHPYLAPLVPQIRDLLREYDVVGGPNVRVEFVDPLRDEELEREAREDYGIESIPFSFAARHEAKLVNAYFHVLVKYGDQFEVIPFEELIDVHISGPGDIEVQAANLEYAITRSIRKVVFGFQSIDNLLASVPEDVKLTLYVTPDALPEELGGVPQTIETVAGEFSARSDRFRFEKVVPDSEALERELHDRYGFQPFAASLFSEQRFYLHLLLEIGDRIAQVPLMQARSEGDIRAAITEGLKRAAPGFMRTVGLVVPPAEPMAMPHQGMQPQQPRPPQGFTQLRRALEAEYEVRMLELDDDIPPEIDAIVLAGPADLSGAAVRRIDQFVMQGGGLIVLAGRYRLDLTAMDLAVAPVSTGLEDALATYGIEIPQSLVLDDRNDTFPVPVTRDLGGLRVQEVRLIPYPFFIHARRSQLADDSPVTSGLRGAILHWASPVRAEATDDVEVVELARSSSSSWLQAHANVKPDFARFPDKGFGMPSGLSEEERGPATLATMLTGRFDSHFARGEEPPPTEDHDPDIGSILERSVPDARIAVVGSSSFVSDELVQLARQTGSELVAENFQLVHNLVDWAVTDTELLSIRSSGGFMRVLEVAEDERRRWEAINYAIVALLLLVVVAATTLHRRTLVPMSLTPPARKGPSTPADDGPREPEPEGSAEPDEAAPGHEEDEA